LEYITAEVLDSTIIAMKEGESKSIRPYDIVKGISSDNDLVNLFKENEIKIFDPEMKTNRAHIIGRDVEEVYYQGRKQDKK
jgi:hypothetical protein